ncbi:DUF3488 and transglutaminase-like domain-containing protein [soil metagenome]
MTDRIAWGGGRISSATALELAERRKRPALLDLTILLAISVTAIGLHVVVDGALWWVQMTLLCGLVLGAAALARRLVDDPNRLRAIPSLAGIVVGLGALTGFFVPTTAVLAVIPTFASFRAFGTLFRAGIQSINEQSVPANMNPALLFLTCLGLALIAIVCDALANSAKAPALVGLPLLVLLAVPSVVSIESTDVFIFVLSGLSYLLILRTASARRQTRLSFGIAGVVVLGALVVPALLPSPGSAEVVNQGVSTGVNPVLSLGRDLRQDIDHPVLEYSTKSGDGHYLRLVSIDDFSGANWSPDVYRIDRSNTPESIAGAPGLSGSVKRTTDTTAVQIGNLTSPWIPVPYPAVSVRGLSGAWYWNAENLDLHSPNVTSQAQQYTARSLEIAPTPAQLSAAGTTVPAGLGKYLALPGDMPKNIAATANRVAGNAASNYDKALLLQDFFRNGDFEYSEVAPVENGYDGTGMQVISQFLKAKSGYCIHFATSMAVMARDLGIPARVDVGFLPGERNGRADNGDIRYEVTSHDLHAWPELYFEGIGWTRFEPTVSLGDVPSYADTADSDVPTPTNPDVPATESSATPTPTSSALANDAGAADTSGTTQSTTQLTVTSIVAPIVLILVLFALLSPSWLRARRRSVRFAGLRRGAPAQVGYTEILETTTDLGFGMPSTATLREVGALLAPRLGARPDVAASLSRVIEFVERESYARVGPTAGSGQPTDGGVADDVAAVIAGLEASVGRGTRLRARFAPPSLWSWLPRWFGDRR